MWATCNSDGRRSHVVRDPVLCTLCGHGPDLSRGAVVKLPGTHRWLHRACLPAHPDVAQAIAKRVARTLAFRERRQWAPEVR